MKKRKSLRLPSSRRIWVHVLASAVLAVLIIGGVALHAYRTYQASSPLSSSEQKVGTREALPPNLDGLLPVEAVKELPTDANQAPVTDLALENRSGLLIYVLTLKNGAKLGFNAVSGEAVALQDDSKAANQEKEGSLPANFIVNTSFEKARQLAQAAFPNGKIHRIQLRAEGDIVTLRVRFADNARVDINAANGDVVRVMTSTGAIAEKSTTPSESSSSTHLSQDPSGSAYQAAPDDKKPGRGNSAATHDRPDGPEKESNSARHNIEGALILANGIYTITQNGATYVIQTDQDIRGWVGQTVRAKGSLQADNIIKATKIEPRR